MSGFTFPLKLIKKKNSKQVCSWMTELRRETNVSNLRNLGIVTNNNVFVGFGN